MKIHADYKRFEAATDADAMRPHFEKALGHVGGAPVALEQFRVPRVFPRADGGFTIQYRMEMRKGNGCAGETLILCGHLLSSSATRPGWAADRRAFVVEGLDLIVPVFPFDPVLQSLAELRAQAGTPRILASCYRKLAPGAAEPVVKGRRVLGYRMERRCVELDTLGAAGSPKSDERNVIVRMLKPRKARASSRTAAMLAANGFGAGEAVTVPGLLEVDAEKGIQCMEFVRGEALHDLTGETSFGVACDAAAQALRRLHAAPLRGLPDYPVEREIEQLRSWVLVGGKIFPEWSVCFEESYDAVASGPPGGDVAERVCIHRDFYDKQVLYSADRVTLVDFDNAAAGDAAQDYGNFTAHLILRSEQESECAENILNGMKAFEQSYGARDAAFAARARWWQAATLLRLAVLYALRPRWRHLAPGLAEKTMASVNTQS
ncbi:MAG: phosphotransferase family protein [Candidatus Krumholzibacteriia bacterium]